jgi:type VI protein secretion system component Hcp
MVALRQVIGGGFVRRRRVRLRELAVVGAAALALPAGASAAAGTIAFPGGDIPKAKIQSFSWGVNLPSSTGTGGGGGAPNLSEIQFKKPASSATPTLFDHAVRGLHIQTAVVRFEESPLRICLKEALVTGLTERGSGKGKVTEEVSLNYAKILVGFDLGIAQIPVAGYDVSGKVAWSGPCP